jgi:hypothetical protein
MNPLKPKPFLEELSNSTGVATINKEMVGCFRCFFEKRAKATIWPTTLLLDCFLNGGNPDEYSLNGAIDVLNT